MAKFTVQGTLGSSLSPHSGDPFRCRYGTFRFLENLPLHVLHLSRDKPGRSCRSYKVRSVGKKKSSGSGASERCLEMSDIDVVAVDGDDDEFGRDELSCFRGLVLDISYRPVNVVCWRRAICLEFMEKVDVLEYYDQTVSSPSGSFFIPAVLRVPHLLQVAKRRRIKHNLSRKSIFFRDHYLCQYCSSSDNLTIDHVLPNSRGGEWKWENLVTACAKCNSKKGQKTLEEANMKLIKVPKALKDFDILAIPLTNTAIRMLRMRKGMPDEWRQYLSKSSMEP
ncbi:uncharacterized protein [Aristolochia californica]|uniref:uncharacterized protein n=1 Tax=Aristolochia californica TaxID=171875 RepID=UPI0035E08A33